MSQIGSSSQVGVNIKNYVKPGILLYSTSCFFVEHCLLETFWGSIPDRKGEDMNHTFHLIYHRFKSVGLVEKSASVFSRSYGKTSS